MLRRSTSCFKVLERPIKKKRAAASARIATPAMAMPTIAPVDRAGCDVGAGVALGDVAAVGIVEEEGVDAGVDESIGIPIRDEVELGLPSPGKLSPGCSIYVDLPAISFWLARETDAFCDDQLDGTEE